MKYKNAENSAPKKCKCGRKLGKPQYGFPWSRPLLPSMPDVLISEYKAPITTKVWFIPCECGIRHVWSAPRNWIMRSNLPLFDTKEFSNEKDNLKWQSN